MISRGKISHYTNQDRIYVSYREGVRDSILVLKGCFSLTRKLYSVTQNNLPTPNLLIPLIFNSSNVKKLH